MQLHAELIAIVRLISQASGSIKHSCAAVPILRWSWRFCAAAIPCRPRYQRTARVTRS